MDFQCITNQTYYYEWGKCCKNSKALLKWCTLTEDYAGRKSAALGFTDNLYSLEVRSTIQGKKYCLYKHSGRYNGLTRQFNFRSSSNIISLIVTEKTKALASCHNSHQVHNRNTQSIKDSPSCWLWLWHLSPLQLLRLLCGRCRWCGLLAWDGLRGWLLRNCWNSLLWRWPLLLLAYSTLEHAFGGNISPQKDWTGKNKSIFQHDILAEKWGRGWLIHSMKDLPPF